MKAIELQQAVKNLKKAYRKNNVIPVCDNVFNNNGKLTVTDLETTYTVNVGFYGKFIFDFTMFEKITSKVNKNSDVEIYQENDKIIILVDKKGRFSLVSIDLEEWPNIPVCSENIGILNDSQIENIKKAARFVNEYDDRPMLRCVCISDHIVGTDAHKMVYFKNKRLKNDFNVPAKITKLMNDNIYTVFVGEKHISLVSDNESITFTVTQGTYPSYMNVIPKDNEIIYELDTKELKEVINMALITANQSSQLIKFHFNDKCTISSEDVDFDVNFNQEIPVKIINEGDITIGFKAKFLLELLSICEEKVVFKLKDSDRAVLIDDDKLLMPMAIQG